MSNQSQAERARKEKDAKLAVRKLPMLWKFFLYFSLTFLCLGKTVYSAGIFTIVTVDDCKLTPSDLDVFMSDFTTIMAVVLTLSLLGAIHYLENK